MNLSPEDANVSSDMSFHQDDFEEHEMDEPVVKYRDTRKNYRKRGNITIDAESFKFAEKNQDSDESPILSQKSS